MNRLKERLADKLNKRKPLRIEWERRGHLWETKTRHSGWQGVIAKGVDNYYPSLHRGQTILNIQTESGWHTLSGAKAAFRRVIRSWET
jgi:hypothetical protein